MGALKKNLKAAGLIGGGVSGAYLVNEGLTPPRIEDYYDPYATLSIYSDTGFYKSPTEMSEINYNKLNKDKTIKNIETGVGAGLLGVAGLIGLGELSRINKFLSMTDVGRTIKDLPSLPGKLLEGVEKGASRYDEIESAIKDAQLAKADNLNERLKQHIGKLSVVVPTPLAKQMQNVTLSPDELRSIEGTFSKPIKSVEDFINFTKRTGTEKIDLSKVLSKKEHQALSKYLNDPQKNLNEVDKKVLESIAVLIKNSVIGKHYGKRAEIIDWAPFFDEILK